MDLLAQSLFDIWFDFLSLSALVKFLLVFPRKYAFNERVEGFVRMECILSKNRHEWQLELFPLVREHVALILREGSWLLYDNLLSDILLIIIPIIFYLIEINDFLEIIKALLDVPILELKFPQKLIKQWFNLVINLDDWDFLRDEALKLWDHFMDLFKVLFVLRIQELLINHSVEVVVISYRLLQFWLILIKIFRLLRIFAFPRVNSFYPANLMRSS